MKKEKLLIIIILISIFLFLLISVVIEPNSNIWVFPFLPGIWGTVSDWVMVWVTAITAIYLIKTFHKQQRLTEIEIVKFKERLKPKFEGETKLVESRGNPDGSSIAKFSLKLYVRNSNAYNVKYNFFKRIYFKN